MRFPIFGSVNFICLFTEENCNVHILPHIRLIPKWRGLRLKGAMKFFSICGISGVTEKYYLCIVK